MNIVRQSQEFSLIFLNYLNCAQEWNGDLALKHIEGKEIHLRVFILPLTSQNG